MSQDYSLHGNLDSIQQKSLADQCAVYYFSYPEFNSLILSAFNGDESHSQRYWRPYCTEAVILAEVQQAREAFPLSGEGITGITETLIAVPISGGSDVIGLVVFCYHGEQRDDLETLSANVAMHARALFDGWVEFLVAERSRPLSVLFHIAGCISASLDLDRVLLSVVEQATILFRAKMSSLMMVDQSRRELEMKTAYGCSLEYLDKPNVPLDNSILGRLVLENRGITIETIQDEPLYLHREWASREGVNSLIAAPITFQNEVLGVLNIYSSNPRRWQQSERELLQTFADHAAIAITNASVHEQIMSMEEQIQVSAKRATLGELAAGLAHEIRNPLAVINMLIHSWKGQPPRPEEFGDDVEVIAQKISDLNTLVTDLLDLAKTRPIELKPTNLVELIERVLRLLRHRITQERVQLKKRLPHTPLDVWMDRERIEQAILNLVLNALDVTPHEGRLGIHVEQQPDRVGIHVTDSGPGISDEHLPLLFKPFNTTKSQGVGLGLPMTQRIVKEHNGEIVVKNNKPSGATFTIWLPMGKPASLHEHIQTPE